MRKYLIEQNRALRGEISRTIEKLNDNKKRQDDVKFSIYIVKQKIDSLSDKIDTGRSCISINIDEVKSIKTKLSHKYDELEAYNRDLTYLFSKKESAYSSKDYSSVNRIKSEIEGVKSSKEDIYYRINDLKKQRDNLSDYIGKLKNGLDSKYNERSRLFDEKNSYVATLEYLNSKREDIRQEIGKLKAQIEENNTKIQDLNRKSN